MFPDHDADVAVMDDTSVKQMPPYHVILLDDDFHTFDYVIEMLQTLFKYESQKAFKMAQMVHEQKRCIVYTGSKEVAEFKQEQILSYGKDHRIPQCKGSMSAVIEPAR